MTAQLEFGAPDRACEWCAAAPAVRWIVGTFACEVCATGSAHERVIAALRRWSRR